MGKLNGVWLSEKGSEGVKVYPYQCETCHDGEHIKFVGEWSGEVGCTPRRDTDPLFSTLIPDSHPPWVQQPGVTPVGAPGTTPLPPPGIAADPTSAPSLLMDHRDIRDYNPDPNIAKGKGKGKVFTDLTHEQALFPLLRALAQTIVNIISPQASLNTRPVLPKEIYKVEFWHAHLNYWVFTRGFLVPPSRACSCRCMLVASSVSPSSALSPLPSGVLKRSFCLPSAAVALLPCACRSSFARVCRPSSAQSVSSCIPVLDWRHHLCLSILFWDGRCQIEVISKPSSAAEWLTSSDEF